VISIVLVGADGRMGRAIEAAAATDRDATIAARVDHGGARRADSPDGANAARGLADVVRDGDVVVDFSAPDGFRAAAEVCRARALPLVTGTTGLGKDDDALLDEVAKRAPVLRSANFSLGVLALRAALRAALDSLPATWDIEIVERHHRAKVDSPSGTALALAQDAARQRGLGEEAFRHGRSGRVGPRQTSEIGLHSVRGGSWIGDHAVLLAGAGESLELRHVAEDRTAFAHGALAAARFLATAPPARYALEDLLQHRGRSGVHR